MSAPAVAQTQVIIDWLTGLGWDTAQELGYPLLPGPLILDAPDQVAYVTCTGGPGYTTEEGATDAWSFQVFIRGPSDDVFDPQIMAATLDALIFTAQFPVQVDGVTIVAAHRAGGPPAPLPVDPSDLRHCFTCSYIIVTGPGD